MFLNTKVVEEKIRGEVGGVIVEVTKKHIVTVPVDIDIDLATGKANVTTYHADVSCFITSDVVALAPKKEEEAKDDEDDEAPPTDEMRSLINGFCNSLLGRPSSIYPSLVSKADYGRKPSFSGYLPALKEGQ